MALDLSSIIPPLAALGGVALGAYLTKRHSIISRHQLQKDLYRLLRAEMLNLQRHCTATARAFKTQKRLGLVVLKKGKYNDTGLIALNIRDLYILDENLCQDLMQMSLRIRNNDFHIDELIAITPSGDATNETTTARDVIVRKLERTAENAGEIAKRLQKHIARPEHYSEPQLDQSE